MQDWLDTQPPSVYWVSGLYFPAAFLTGTKQNFARREKVPIDDVAFDFTFMTEDSYTKQPANGVYTNGLFFDGARWNKEKGLLDDPLPKVLFSSAPIIWMEPKESKICLSSSITNALYTEQVSAGVCWLQLDTPQTLFCTSLYRLTAPKVFGSVLALHCYVL